MMAFVETKLKENAPALPGWEIIQKPGHITNNARGGSLIQARNAVNMGKNNPPTINNALNECLHISIPFQNEKLHIFLVYIHPTSAIDTLFTKASLYKYSIIVGDLNVDARKKRHINMFLNNSNFKQKKTEPHIYNE